METNERIPTREELDERYTWDLRDIYPTDEDWEADFARFTALPERIISYKGRLGESAQTLLEFLRLSDQHLATAFRIMRSERATRTRQTRNIRRWFQGL